MFLDKTSAKARRHGIGQAPLCKNLGGLLRFGWLLAIGVGSCRGHD